MARSDQLERMGFVRREPDPEDGRGTLVTSRKGGRLFDAVAPVHLSNESDLVATLTRTERETLAALLRKLLLTFEHPTVRS